VLVLPAIKTNNPRALLHVMAPLSVQWPCRVSSSLYEPSRRGPYQTARMACEHGRRSTYSHSGWHPKPYPCSFFLYRTPRSPLHHTQKVACPDGSRAPRRGLGGEQANCE
jgi:hypothetical protein